MKPQSKGRGTDGPASALTPVLRIRGWTRPSPCPHELTAQSRGQEAFSAKSQIGNIVVASQTDSSLCHSDQPFQARSHVPGPRGSAQGGLS